MTQEFEVKYDIKDNVPFIVFGTKRYVFNIADLVYFFPSKPDKVRIEMESKYAPWDKNTPVIANPKLINGCVVLVRDNPTKEREESDKPIVVERFADNGEHSHWEVIEPKNCEILWSGDDSADNNPKPVEGVMSAEKWMDKLYPTREPSYELMTAYAAYVQSKTWIDEDMINFGEYMRLRLFKHGEKSTTQFLTDFLTQYKKNKQQY